MCAGLLENYILQISRYCREHAEVGGASLQQEYVHHTVLAIPVKLTII